MKTIFKGMFLKAGSGTKENGEIYYFGNFLDNDSTQTINLYFSNSNLLSRFKLKQDYDIPCELYMVNIYNKNNQRVTAFRLKVLEDEIKF